MPFWSVRKVLANRLQRVEVAMTAKEAEPVEYWARNHVTELLARPPYSLRGSRDSEIWPSELDTVGTMTIRPLSFGGGASFRLVC